MVFISPFSGRLIGRFGARRLMTAGMALRRRRPARPDPGRRRQLLRRCCWPATCCSGSPSASSTRRCRPRRWRRCRARRSGSPPACWRWTGSLAGAVALAATGAVFHALLGDGDSFAAAVAGSTWVAGRPLRRRRRPHLGLRPRPRAARAGPGVAGDPRRRAQHHRTTAASTSESRLTKRSDLRPVHSDIARPHSRAVFAILEAMSSCPGDELHELSERQDPRLLRALDVVAPGGALREGIDNIVHSRTGGLIVVGDPDDISHLLSGGIKLDIDYTPAMLYQVAKMDGAIVLNAEATKIAWANVQLMPDPTILSSRDRHPPPHRRARLQTDRRAGDRDLPAPRRRLPLRRGDQVHPPGHPRRARQGQPGPGDAREVPRAPRPGLRPASPCSSSRAAASSTTRSPSCSGPSW